MNISLAVQFGKNWELENGKKIEGFGIPMLKLVILEENPVAGDIDYISL